MTCAGNTRRGTKAAVLLTRTGPDGSFRLSPGDVKAARDGSAQLVAMAEGYGPAFLEPAGGDAAPVLRLARDDVPIRGRVIDIQGRPVAGATIQLVGILRPNSGTLDEWLDALKKERAAYPAQSRMLRSWSGDDIPALFPAVVADREGRFTLKGVGRERIAALLVDGPGIETAFEYVATRDMPAVKVPLLSGTTAQTRRRVSRRRARARGRPRPRDRRDGPRQGQRPATGRHHRADDDALRQSVPLHFKTTTDARGDYRLSGLPLKTSSAGTRSSWP